MSHNDLPFLPKKNLEAWKLACNFNHQGFHVGHFRNLAKNLNHRLKRLEKFYGVINLINKLAQYCIMACALNSKKWKQNDFEKIDLNLRKMQKNIQKR